LIYIYIYINNQQYTVKHLGILWDRGFQAAIVKSNQVLESPISWTFELQSILGVDPKGLRAKRGINRDLCGNLWLLKIWENDDEL
jgi:hypothetical protein